MKACIFLVLMILCSVYVTATNITFENVVDKIVIKVNGKTYEDADTTGGDIDVSRTDKLEFKIYFDNTYGNNSQVKVVGTIFYLDDGDELEDEQSYFTLNKNIKTTRTLSYTIPLSPSYILCFLCISSEQ